MEEIKINENFELYWKRRFNEAALNFESDADVGLWSEYGFRQRFITFFNVFKEISNNKRMRILDVGCGTGAYDRVLANMGHEVIGIDYSEYAIYKAVEKSKGKDIQYLISAVPYLPFKNESFDLVICIGVLQYVENEQDMICEIKRVLKNKEGILILITLNSFSIRVFFKKVIEIFHIKNKKEINERRYNPFKLKNMFKDFSEFKIVGIYIFPKIDFSRKSIQNVSKILHRLYPISLLLAHAFLIKVVRIKR